MFWDLGASGVGSKVWVLTIGVLEVNPERDSIRAQRGPARSALFSRVSSYNKVGSCGVVLTLKYIVRKRKEKSFSTNFAFLQFAA